MWLVHDRETKPKTQRAAGRGHIPKVSGSGPDVKATLKALEAGATGISGLHSRLIRGVSSHLEGKQRIPLSSRVTMGISWSPLCVLKGVKPRWFLKKSGKMKGAGEGG